jgi:peptidoglycan-N-acetylglucosamine deacetylase
MRLNDDQTLGRQGHLRRRRFLGLLGAGVLGTAVGTGLAHSGGTSEDADRERDAARDDIDEEVARPTRGEQRIIWSVETESPVAALTFDDGPDPEFTPRILDILDRYGVKATFMMMGYNADVHPELVREVVAAGHEVGSHGWRHFNLAETTYAETRREIESGIRLVEERAGAQVRVFRPPYGRFGEAAVRLLGVKGFDLVLWSVTRGRLAWRAPEKVASHVVGALGPGHIVDLHDGIGRGTFNRGARFAERLRQRRHVEVAALPQILEGAAGRGAHFVTISDLIAQSTRDRGA